MQHLLWMFVVTALYTKRRPIVAVREQCVEKLELLSVVPYSHRHVYPTKFSYSARRVLKPRMTHSDGDRNTWNRNEKGRRQPIKLALARPASRIRRFIPKPLILVERMKARQLLLEVSPSVNRSTTAMTTPLSTHVTPTPQRILTCSVLSSDSHSSSSVSFRMSARKGIVFESGFRAMPRSTRPLSVVTLGESPSSTDTFVTDSPCCIKQASKVPVLVMEIGAANISVSVESDSEKKPLSDTGVSVLVDSVAQGAMHPCLRPLDTFEPTVTSTPLASSQANTNNVRTPELSNGFEIVSLTSRAAYPFNTPKGAYIIKLPHGASTTPPSNETRLAPMARSKLTNIRAPLTTLANAPGSKPSLDLRRLSNRIASPSPTLVLDGVFALPSSPHSPRQTPLHRFPRPRKPSAWRFLPPPPPLSPPPPPSPPPPTPCATLAPDMNALPVAPRSPPHSPSTGSCGQPRSGPESPRSKLAHVLTAHVRQTPSVSMSVSVSVSMLGLMTQVPRPDDQEQMKDQGQGQVKGRTLVPPLVRGIQVSNDSRTQCEIEGLRMRRAVQAGCGGGDGGSETRNEGTGNECAGGDCKGPIERVGMVAKLRARWERGEGTCDVSR